MRYKPNTVLILLVCFFSCTNLFAQQPLNLDFEKQSIEGYKRPWGWDLGSYGQNTKIYLDSIFRHNGKFSLHIVSPRNARIDTMVVSYLVEPYSFKGKKTRVEGWVRTENYSGGVFLVTGYSLRSGNGYVEKTDTARFISKKTNGWQKIILENKIPENASGIILKLIGAGQGDLWYDDLSIFVDGRKINEAEVAPAFTNAQMNWLKQNTTPFVSVDASPLTSLQADSDLDFFKKLCGNASLIALGESTHGTSEFFRLKHRILAYAVKNMGARVFAIEDNAVIVERANRYIQGGPGSARGSMQGMFSVWQNEEVHAMIQWLRDYNDLHPDDKVSFVGFDVQHVKGPADSLLAFLSRKDVRLKDSVSVWLKDLAANESQHYMATDSIKKKWFHVSETMLRVVSARKAEWLSKTTNRSDTIKVEQGIQYANLVQHYAHNLYAGHRSLYRDVAMAENISWILSMQKTGTKIIIWAHDNHISRGDHPEKDDNIYYGISMGSHLSKKYGNNYKSFGLSSFTGSYWAQVSYLDFRQQPCPLLAAPRGSLDEAMHRIALAQKKEFLFLDLKHAKEQTWFTKRTPVRFANHVNIEYGYWTRFSIPYQFDGIFFMDTTNAARSYAK